MPPDAPSSPDDPLAWLQLAREDLTLSQAQVEGVTYRPMCYHAQQAAEKAIKAVMLSRSIAFPYIHDIGRLLGLAKERGIEVPTDVIEADILTDFATLGRYPSLVEIERTDYERAIDHARVVVEWAEAMLA
jgi:HEPN domain-containing protein